ncbi:hypothetical protein O181_074998 [Austropuccinia psidii MF-1]|uniref:3-hydroxyisobutyrate dehydrogenase n=1 Tax=Austropuccinia psidii MF-1 TaxID=1389203 RepID=A0A9Q3IBG3_9BASI|nr:hypothetical protein [Austropuccinia psidii MF-1]
MIMMMMKARKTSKSIYSIKSFSTGFTLTNHSRKNSIGFIGLGAMGREMATNLITKTEMDTFIIHDTCQSSITNFLQRNSNFTSKIVKATSPASLARLSSTIITVLPSSDQVEEVYLNPQTGILNAIQNHSESSTLCIDSTTLNLNRAKAVSHKIHHAGGTMLDAPVSGGVVGAREGRLTFMCGGQENTFAKAQTFLSKMGRKSIYCGESGSGLAAKLANNMLLAISMVGTAEAMILGQSLGLKPDLLATIINSSTGRCWSSEINNPAPGALMHTNSTPADRNWEGGFASKLMSKDLDLALQAANDSSITPQLPISQLVDQIYQIVGSDPKWDYKDFSVVYEWLRSLSK